MSSNRRSLAMSSFCTVCSQANSEPVRPPMLANLSIKSLTLENNKMRLF